MNQKYLESQHKSDLLACGTGKIWRLEDIRLSISGWYKSPTKRTLERWVSRIPWLKSSHKIGDQVDELNRPANKLVLSSLVSGARKKRKTTLFVQIHRLPITNEDKQHQEFNVIVAEDGKGTKRWCLLARKEISVLSVGLFQLAEGKQTIFFPSGRLVAVCRELNRLGQNHNSIFNVETGQYPETNSSKEDQPLEIKTVAKTQTTKLSHLDWLEAESIYIIREVVAQAENPVMLYSVGKDSSVMLHLARKAFFPSPPPFPLMHVDTQWKFQAMYDFRDNVAKTLNMKLIVHTNPEGVEKNINPIDHGSELHTDIMKTQGLKQALDLHKFDVAFGGARRDEEKSRAKERIFSFRSNNHYWDPKDQRPELWNLFNCRKASGESFRVFPLSNWTELEIWQYIYRENIPVVPLYFAAERPVVKRNGMLIMIDDDRMKLLPDETIEMKKIRFRTLGCYPLTGAIESSAIDISSILLELLQSKTSERQTRAIDKDGSSSMEKKKQEGYF